MKKLLLFALITTVITSCSQKTIELPLIYKDGYGPFLPHVTGLSPYSNNHIIQLKVEGVPQDWKNAKIGHITMNRYQEVYQNFLLDNVSEEYYKNTQWAWHWTPDTLKLSKTPIKTSIAFVYEKEASGTYRMILDANNNLDFSDDKIFPPMPMSRITPNDSILKLNQIMITHESFLNNEVITVHTPIYISYPESIDMLFCNYPRYAVAKFKGEEFAISSNDFTDVSYDEINIVMLNDSLKQGKKANDSQDYLEEYIKIEGEIYKIEGVEIEKDVLVLEKVNTPEDQIYSTQVGFKSPLFKGEDFLSKDSLALEDFRGKYLYLDFWSLGCRPCIQELPHLKELYDKLDKSQFEFLGIVSNSNEDALKKMMDKHSVSWSNILSSKKNDINKLYEVIALPATILLDKEGRIIATDLRHKELEEKINQLTKSTPKN